jgi:hypothetical protein
MKRYAHIQDGKVTNITMHSNDFPIHPEHEHSTMCDLTHNPDVKIGDEMINGRFVSQDAIKTLEQAKQVCLTTMHNKLAQALEENVDGFKVNNLAELYAIYQLTVDSKLITVKDDEDNIRQLEPTQFNNILNNLAQSRQNKLIDMLQDKLAINQAKSIKELTKQFPNILTNLHPKAK